MVIPVIDHKLDLDDVDYIIPSKNILKTANLILAEDPRELDWSILTDRDKKMIKNK